MTQKLICSLNAEGCIKGECIDDILLKFDEFNLCLLPTLLIPPILLLYYDGF